MAKRAKRAKTVLAGMDFQSLMDLREQVETALSGYRETLERQLASLGGSIASIAGGGKERGSKMKGRSIFTATMVLKFLLKEILSLDPLFTMIGS